MSDINWGPTGELVYDRTYARTKPDGSRETWPETVRRVVSANLSLVDPRFHLPGEREDLIGLMEEFKIIPGGRHLWASGVKGAQHLFNCWVAGWTERPADHFEFTFLRLMEGGGVGANYSNHYLAHYPPVQQELYVHIVCDEEHPDYQQMVDAGVLSTEYDPDWAGAFVIEDSREGWAAALVDLIDTHYREEVTHYQRVYDVTRVRHAGAKLRTFGGRASGPLPLARMLIDVCEILSESHLQPVPYQGQYPDRRGYLTGMAAMEIDHAIAQCVVAGGVRRSARMAMMHWRDQQIEEFLSCKSESGDHWTTNISVEVDETFWQHVAADNSPDHPMYFEQYREEYTHAKWVLQQVSKGMHRNGEPGLWDSSLSNKGEPNEVVCTNPCGEITLEPWEPCNLGHVNLAGFVNSDGSYMLPALRYAHRLMARFLIRATFSPVSDPKSQEVLLRNRRIGVGHLGVASFLALTGTRYSQAVLDGEFRQLLRTLASVVDQEVIWFSHDLRIPAPVKTRTVAPTGTIAKLPGVSEGIHPIFSKYFNRRIRFNHGSDYQALADLVNIGYDVEDDLYAPNTAVVTIPTKDKLLEEVTAVYGADSAERLVESAADLTLNEMLAFQAMYQMLWADNAVSFTANIDPEEYAPLRIEYQLRKFGGLLKGVTVFPDLSRPQAPYERITKEEFESAPWSVVADGVDEQCASGACPVR